MESTTGRVQFHARVASNALAMVARQLAATIVPDAVEIARGKSPNAQMAASTVARLAVANPGYLSK